MDKHEIAITTKKNLDYILFPLFLLSIFYLPGFLLSTFVNVPLPNNFFIRQFSYILYSLPFIMLSTVGLKYLKKYHTQSSE